MRQFVAGHRAMLGIVGVAAFVLMFGLLALPDAPLAVEISLLLAALFGLGALVGSPYWKIVYREAPLNTAAGRPTDLDEREHGLRDRANGLAYFLFFTINICLLGIAFVLIQLHHLALDAKAVEAIIIPYGMFGAALPVILLEWFEPSGPAPAALDEEDEG